MDPAHQGHPGALDLASRPFSWLALTPLAPDEALSSWLVRAAFAQGCAPLPFAGGIWPGWRAWTVDIDRAIAPERLRVLAQYSAVQLEILESMTLRPLLHALSTEALPMHGCWTWLRGLGARNRRRKGGMQFCPACLAGDARPYFRKGWRLSWQVACPVHRAWLRAHCDHCGAAVEYLRLGLGTTSLATCASCGDVLSNEPPPLEREDALLSRAVALQAQADAQAEQALCGNAVAVAWFGRLRFCLSLTRACLRESFPALGRLSEALHLNAGGRVLGFGTRVMADLPAHRRARLMQGAAQLMAMHTETLIDALRTAGLTRQGVAVVARNPPDLDAGLATLPSARPRTAAPTGESQRARPPAPVRAALVRQRWRRLMNQWGWV